MTTTTETATHPLEILFQLQDLLLIARKKSEQKDRIPEHLQHVDAAFKEISARRAERQERLKAAEARKKALEGEISDVAEKTKKYQGQLPSVKTNREYGALLNEIDGVKREVRAREDEILALEEQIATLKAEQAEVDATFPEEEARFEEQMAGWREEQAILAVDAERASKRAAELRAGVDKKMLANFDRIAKARGGIAVVKVMMMASHTAACAGCNLRLRPQLLSDVRLSKEMVHCEGCRRILYWDHRADL